MITRSGELHPWLRKVESFFMPIKNTFSALDFVLVICKVCAFLIMSAFFGFILLAFIDGLSIGDSINDFILHALMIATLCAIITAYIVARAAYYRLQDLPLPGWLAYVFFPIFLLYCLQTVYQHFDISWHLNRIITFLMLLILCIPGPNERTAFVASLSTIWYGPNPR